MSDFEVEPPHDIGAEQATLGAMLLSPIAITDAAKVIDPEDHYRPAHQLVHEAILELYTRGDPTDAITVANELTRRGAIGRIGDSPYLHTLIASVSTAASAGYYARIVREHAVRRRRIEDLERQLRLTRDLTVDLADIEAASRQAVTITTGAALPDYDLGALADKGVPPPDLMCGELLYAGGLHSIAGAPDSGKSVLCYWWALQLRRAGRNVMILDEEAGPEQVVEKMTALGAIAEELQPPEFTYVPFPARTWTSSDLAALHERVADRQPALTCWDSSAAFMASGGLDENSAADVTRFWTQVLAPCARQHGSAVVIIDHDGKNGETSRYARGSGAKLAATDVAYKLEAVKPFDRVNDGILNLTATKDRRGWLHRHHRITVTVRPVLALDIRESESETQVGQVHLPPAQAKLLGVMDGVPATAAALVDRVVAEHGHGLKRETVSRALNALLEAGLADRTDQGSGKAALWMRSDWSDP